MENVFFSLSIYINIARIDSKEIRFFCVCVQFSFNKRLKSNLFDLIGFFFLLLLLLAWQKWKEKKSFFSTLFQVLIIMMMTSAWWKWRLATYRKKWTKINKKFFLFSFFHSKARIAGKILIKISKDIILWFFVCSMIIEKFYHTYIDRIQNLWN